MSIKNKITQLEKIARERHKIAVLIVEQNTDGIIYTVGDETLTERRLQEYAKSRGVESLIIDDL